MPGARGSRNATPNAIFGGLTISPKVRHQLEKMKRRRRRRRKGY